MPLTAEQRRELPDDAFALPGKRALPIHDARHVRMAWSQVGQARDLSDGDRNDARRRIKAKADNLGLNTEGWKMAAADDKGLYISRPLTPESAAAFRTWAETQGFTEPMPGKELHVTIVHSEVSADLEPHDHHVTVEGGDRSVVRLGDTRTGDRGAMALRFVSDELRLRWQEALESGCTCDFEDYLPHVTIAWGNEPIEVDNITPFLGDLVFGPEVHAPLKTEEKGLSMQAGASIRLDGEGMEAMALQMPDVAGHPNRMPFSGILTRLDVASDRAPGGSGGKKVIFTMAAAERALASLIGMAVDFTPDFDGHDAVRKFGVITAATIEGNAIRVGGHIYAKDFPKEASRVRTDKALLGMSWELAEIYVESPTADPLVITDAYFTGAAILRKDKAAYQSTSLAASAGEDDMTKEEIVALVGESVGQAMAVATKPITDALAQIQASAEASAKAVTDLQAAATKTVEEEAALALKAKDERLAELETAVKDLKAAAEKEKTEPQRKTLAPAITALLAKADLQMPDGDGKLTIGAVDQALAKANLEPAKRLEIKSALKHANVLA